MIFRANISRHCEAAKQPKQSKTRRILGLIILILFISQHNIFAQDAHGNKAGDGRFMALRYRAMELQMLRSKRFMARRRQAMEESLREILDKRQRLMNETMRALAEKAKKRFFFMVKQILALNPLGPSPIMPR